MQLPILTTLYAQGRGLFSDDFLYFVFCFTFRGVLMEWNKNRFWYRYSYDTGADIKATHSLQTNPLGSA